MKQLAEATGKERAKLADIEREAVDLLAELDNLDVRLHRAHNAVSIDSLVAHLSIERKRMLEDEERAEAGRGLGSLLSLGLFSIVCLCRGQKPDWGRLVSVCFTEEPFGDVRVVLKGNDIRLVNIAKTARERNMDIISVVVDLKQKGNEVLHWEEFEARARNMRRAALSGKSELAEGPKPQALPTGRGPKWVRVSSTEHTP